jgi:hypothetical protein
MSTAKAKETTKQVVTLDSYRASVDAAFEARAAYEKTQVSDADILANKLAKLKAYRANIAHDTILGVCMKSHIDFNFINEATRKDARCDIYRIERVTMLARSIAKTDSLHHYMRAILLSAKAFHTANAEMTIDEVKSACSLDAHSKDAAKEKLVVKYQKHVALSTVQAQHASSVFALVKFGVLKESTNASRKDVYTYQDTATSKALLASL